MGPKLTGLEGMGKRWEQVQTFQANVMTFPFVYSYFRYHRGFHLRVGRLPCIHCPYMRSYSGNQHT